MDRLLFSLLIWSMAVVNDCACIIRAYHNYFSIGSGELTLHLFNPGKKWEGLPLHECGERVGWGQGRPATHHRAAHSGGHLLLPVPRGSGLEV